MNLCKLLWSFDGRIGRAAYAGGLALNWVLVFLATAIVHRASRGLLSFAALSLLPLLTVAVFFCWANLALMAKRLQDLGINGWFSALLFVPGAGLIVIVALLIPPGEDNDNCYGPAPTGVPTPAPH